MPTEAQHLYAFGEFLLDTRQHLLTCRGKPVPLPPKVFETLLMLVQNSGRLVEKDALLQHLWPDTFVEEGNLPKHVSVLRKALSTCSNGSEYIETVPKLGYRFVASLTEIPTDAAPAEQVQPAVVQSANGSRPSQSRRRPVRILLIAAALLAGVLAIAAVLILPSPVAPRVLRTVQLTHSGHAEWVGAICTDGARVYFEERTGGRYNLAWVASAGGESTPIPTPFRNAHLMSISPDRTELLVVGSQGDVDEQLLWALPAAGGPPRRLGNIIADDASWTPNGEGLVFSRGTEVFRANKDGTDIRKIVTVAANAGYFRWSPDGRVLRFTLVDERSGFLSLHEAAPDGSGVHEWLPGWSQRAGGWNGGECCGVWTPDGKYFVFRSSRGGVEGFWTLREKAGLFHRRGSGPSMLYTTPLWVRQAALSLDGKRLFFAGGQESRELLRYDANSKHFVPHLAGIPARYVAFSRDGTQVTYSEDLNLWQSRADGSERRRLTFSPLAAAAPQWSPDGKNIAFRGMLASDGGRIYLVPSEGGSPEALTPPQHATDRPYWSPDGGSLVFSQAAGPVFGGPDCTIQVLDLKTRQASELPGSRGLDAQGFSPDGRYLAAFTTDNRRLMLYEVQARRWTELARANSLYGAYWSRDSNWVYFQDLFGDIEEPIYRVRVANHHVEQVAGFKQFDRADSLAYSLTGLTPDGAPLVSLILGRRDIYALDIDFP